MSFPGIEIGALWMSEKEDGTQVISGKLGGASVLVMKNQFKKAGSKEPDYRIFVMPPLRKEEEQPNAPQERGSRRQG